MARIRGAARAAVVIAGAFALASPAPVLRAQRSTPRPAVGSEPRRDDASGPHRRGIWEEGRPDAHGEGRHGGRRTGTGLVVYLPADGQPWYPGLPGIYYPQSGVYAGPGVYLPQAGIVSQGLMIGQGVPASQGGSGMVYDAYGRPLMPGYAMAPGSGGGGYTPDLSGTPYVVTADGMMLVDLPYREQRSFASCAAQRASRDPSGKPRTIFYQPADYGPLLREGQRGRVQGTPPPGTAACYGIDQVGRVALLY